MAKENRTVLSTGNTLLAGGLTGIINWTLVLPLDVIKSRVQTGEQRNILLMVQDSKL